MCGTLERALEALARVGNEAARVALDEAELPSAGHPGTTKRSSERDESSGLSGATIFPVAGASHTALRPKPSPHPPVYSAICSVFALASWSLLEPRHVHSVDCSKL